MTGKSQGRRQQHCCCDTDAAADLGGGGKPAPRSMKPGILSGCRGTDTDELGSSGWLVPSWIPEPMVFSGSSESFRSCFLFGHDRESWSWEKRVEGRSSVATIPEVVLVRALPILPGPWWR